MHFVIKNNQKYLKILIDYFNNNSNMDSDFKIKSINAYFLKVCKIQEYLHKNVYLELGM